jgi:hypothetical protein
MTNSEKIKHRNIIALTGKNMNMKSFQRKMMLFLQDIQVNTGFSTKVLKTSYNQTRSGSYIIFQVAKY